jgi:hypothetical protein
MLFLLARTSFRTEECSLRTAAVQTVLLSANCKLLFLGSMFEERKVDGVPGQEQSSTVFILLQQAVFLIRND